MTVEQVTVINAHPDSARILGNHSGHCRQCALQSGCGHQLLATATRHSRQALAFELPLPPAMQGKVSPGDTLTLKVGETRLVFLSFLQYLVPLAGLLLGTALGSLMAQPSSNEIMVILCASAGLVAALVLVRNISQGMKLPVALQIPENASEHFIHNLKKNDGTLDDKS